MNTNSELAFPALQGSSLLGFMAALGAFHTLATSSELRSIRMRWHSRGSSFCPALELPNPCQPGQIVEKLHTLLRDRSDHYAIIIDKDLKIPCDTFRNLSRRAVEDFLNLRDIVAASMVASFGCDATRNDGELIEDTAFRTMSGAGHQHFLEFMNVLTKETTSQQLHEALFGPWRYRDPSPTMRWDAEDDRRYALRWDEPSKDPVRTVRGANLLAVAALPCFPTVPLSGTELATTGFRGKGSRDTFVSWPIWNNWLSLDAVCSLLNLSELQHRNASAGLLAPRGIAAVYRSQRITLGKYRNFTPSRAL